MPENAGDQSKTFDFLQAVVQTGYLFHWVGIFKIIVGILLLIPKTAPLGIIMTCGYSVNIVLWVLFVAHIRLPMGVLDFLANMFLVYAYFDYYKPIFTLFKEKQPVQTKTRPIFLSVLCILSFIGSGFLTLYYFAIIALGEFVPFINKIPGMDTIIVMPGGIQTLCMGLGIAFISLFGAIQIWKMKKIGFYIYSGANAFAFILPYIFIPVEKVPYLGIISALLFIILYAINLKHLE